ncbi:MAG: sigma-54 dependent transcriptional regulator [Bacteroidales bacterium]|jgi:DNA-binding NtrC family response regulator|nr:sigma-54 dependent transcriptional regulator [Bacteroidales bacterium]MDD4544519.1 sigma-54 dependent transcriptional regulator [Bacteroidales bacterium]MDY0053799.1 sigma-54 dependent transcriptional regulator [Bacteroidales bacterium]
MRIYVVSDDENLVKRIVYHLNLNPEWESIPFYGVESFLAQKDIITDTVILCYDFDVIKTSECIDLLNTNFNNTKFIHVISQDNEIDYRPYLFDEHIVDVVKNNSTLLDTIWNRISVIYKNQNFQSHVRDLKKSHIKSQFIEEFVSTSENMKIVKNFMDKASQNDINVTIFGETGTGKEVVAKYIHHNSQRWNKKMVAVNVSAIPSELMESAYFGHEKGAFTGAVNRKLGFFEEASGGTLFLDEIGDMDLRMQAKLLRVLQEGEITRVGGNGNIKVDVRVISATHKDLKAEVEKGNFREDLFYRLIGLPIMLPPLRERGEDIIKLAEKFIFDFCRKNKKPLKTFSQIAKDTLLNYSFPGNVRELRAIIELAIVMTDGQVIYPENLSIKTDKVDDNFLFKERTMQEYEIMIIEYYLKKYNYKVRFVANKLGIGKTKIYDMMKSGLIKPIE